MTDLAHTETGTSGPLVVFVHGVLDRGRSFEPIAARLLDCRVITYDRRGYAGSAALPGAPASVSRHADDLIELLDGRRAIVVGHSFGGVTATTAAVRAPELVESLVLYETGMAWAPGWDDTAVRAVLDSADPEVAALRLMFGERYEAMSADEQQFRRRDAAAFVAEEESVRQGVHPFDLKALKAPLIYARSAPTVMPWVADFVREHVPDAELPLIEGAGHHAHRTKPDDFHALVRRGIERATAAR
ncbi:MAG: alpha/beta fold hydrolase [Acidimicrobiia bacterium]